MMFTSSSSPSTATAWHLHAHTSLHWCCWDDEWVVFDVLSGETHVMDTLTAVTLMTVKRSDLALADIAYRVAEDLLMSVDPSFLGAVNHTLNSLATVGLIEAAAP